MRTLLFVLLVVSSSGLSAQFLQDINGRPYLSSATGEVEGSSLLLKEWTIATVLTAQGKTYDSVWINLDGSDNRLLFLRDGQTYSFVENVTEFRFKRDDRLVAMKKGSVLHKTLPDVFFEVMNTQPLFLKNSTRKLTAVSSYDGVQNKSKFTEVKVFYAQIGDNFEKVSLNRDAAEKVFAQKWKAANAFASKEGLSFKTEAGWAALLRQYPAL